MSYCKCLLFYDSFCAEVCGFVATLCGSVLPYYRFEDWTLVHFEGDQPVRCHTDCLFKLCGLHGKEKIGGELSMNIDFASHAKPSKVRISLKFEDSF